MKRFISYLDGLARRTYLGTDGTEPHRPGFVGSLIEGLEGLLGFFRPGDLAGHGGRNPLPLVF